MASNGDLDVEPPKKTQEQLTEQLTDVEDTSVLLKEEEEDDHISDLDSNFSSEERSLSISGMSDIVDERDTDVTGIFDRDEGRSLPPPTGSALSFADSKFVSTDLEKPVELRMTDKGAGSEPPVTVVEVLEQSARKYHDRQALCVKRVGLWKTWTYQKYYEDSLAMAKMFVKLGLEPSHGVCIVGFNSPEWLIANMAAMMAGGIPVGVYINLSAEACCFIADDCKANIIVVDNEQQLNKILFIRDELPHLKAIIQYIGNPPTGEGVYEWSRALALGYDEPLQEVEQRMRGLQPNKCCTLIYTSGTTGTPKGVMLSHDNIMWSSKQLNSSLDKRAVQEHVVSYLPLAHVAAQILDIYWVLIVGGTTWFAQPDALKGSLIQTMREVRPTVFLGVPRVWEKLAIGMQTYSATLSGAKKKLSKWAKSIGLRGNLSKQEGGKTPFGWTLARLLVFKKVSKHLGLERCHHHLTGAAPISDETLSYFLSLDICLHQLYGMSESTGPATVTTEKTLRFRSNGYPMEGTEIMLLNEDEDGVGEVVIQGRNVFMGYLNNLEKTAQVFTPEGFLRSGDFGRIDKDGYLYITGRMKELIILANGDKVAPVPLEQMIKAELPIVSNAVIIGDKRTYLVCLLTIKVEFDENTALPTSKLSPEAVRECRAVGSMAITVDDIIDGEGDKVVLKMIKRGIDKINMKATSKSQKIMRWTVLEGDFSVAGTELTPTLKLKRPVIAEKYSEHIDFLY